MKPVEDKKKPKGPAGKNKPKGKSKVVKFEDGSKGPFLGKPSRASIEAQKKRNPSKK